MRVPREASVLVDGRRLAGAPVERDFFGRRGLSAAHALSETWIEVAPT